MPRLVRRRIQLIVEYWEVPDVVCPADLAAAHTYAESSDLGLYRVLSAGAGTPEPVAYRPYEMYFRPLGPQVPGEDILARRDWEVHDPTPAHGYVPPVFRGTSAECRQWIADHDGTLVHR